MFIKQIELVGFKRFRFAQIRRFEATFTSPVTIITAINGKGKEQPYSSKIRVAGGWTTMGEIAIGDTVICPDNTYSKVIHKEDQGEKEVWEVTFEDGRIVRCGREHLWLIGWSTDNRTSLESVATTEELRTYLNTATCGVPLYRGNRTAESSKDLLISLKAHTIHDTHQYIDVQYDDMVTLAWVQHGVYRLGGKALRLNDTTLRVYKQREDSRYGNRYLRIKSIVATGVMEKQACIIIDHPDHLYLTDNYVVTHNSSLLRELCPLPSVRTEYEPGGYKKLRLEHEGHEYLLSSRFSNRTSPHSFKRDDVELNISGTTDVQEELVAKHFGITTAIRNLIYSKIKICDTTKAERKQLFLNINPMELGLILDTHKRAQSKIKDYKATLQHLYTRKADIEGKLLPLDTLHQHKQTKETLTKDMATINKVIYSLEQHISSIRSQHQDAFQYQAECSSANRPLVSAEAIIHKCKQLSFQSQKYTGIARGDAFQDAYTDCRQKQAEVQQRQSDLSQRIHDLSQEINEYHKHMDMATDRPPSVVEKELLELDTELKKYPPLPERVLPVHELDRHRAMLPEIERLLYLFRDLTIPMLPVPMLCKLRMCHEKNLNRRNYIALQVSRATKALADVKLEYDTFKQKAGIPDTCSLTDCMLRRTIVERIRDLEQRVLVAEKEVQVATAALQHLEHVLSVLSKKISPYYQPDMVEVYHNLLRYLMSYGFAIENWETTLLHKLNTQPMRILTRLEEFVNVSYDAITIRKLQAKKDQLKTELDVLIKSNATSVGFLKQKLTEKEKLIHQYLKDLKGVDTQLIEINGTCALYLEYLQATDMVKRFQEHYRKGERSLLVTHAVTYWENLLTGFREGSNRINEALRHLESVVREQDMLRSTYTEEILKNIEQLEKDKFYYERIEIALSPNTGLPHRSMLKYLNTLIANVNYFISQIWAYPMRILPLSENDPLDYAFPIEVGAELNADISMLSDGQLEVVNLAWVLTILLQLRMLDKIPFFADEIGRTFDHVHKMRILTFMEQLIDNKVINQIFMVNHSALFTDGFKESDVICLSPEAMGDLSVSYNEHVTMTVA